MKNDASIALSEPPENALRVSSGHMSGFDLET